MADVASSSRPAWQTDELLEEWIEEPEEEDLRDDDYNLGNRSQSISFTAPLATTILTNHSTNETTPASSAAGTFLVREDVPDAPFLPKTPGRQKKGLIKDFFTPLPLERMFEPPSPPTASSSALKDDEAKSGSSGEGQGSQGALGSNLGCQFTFAVSRDGSFIPQGGAGGPFIQAQSTPNPPPLNKPTAPMTDPRLRLFQFQYDTFTREHLSAMVDSIAINSPSGQTTSSRDQSPILQGLSRVTEDTQAADNESFSRMRSAKRVKLSPRSHFYGEGAGAEAVISRPKLQGRDYVGESRSLMEKIKLARDFSTISTTVSAQESPPPLVAESRPAIHDPAAELGSLAVPLHNSGTSTTDSSVNSRSGSAYRQQAEALMAQIRGDVKGQKRLFSGDTDATVTTRLDISMDTSHTSLRHRGGKDDSRDSSFRIRRPSSSHSTYSTKSRHSPRRVSTVKSKGSAASVAKLAGDVSRLSVQDDALSAPEVTVTPPTITLATTGPLPPSPRVPPSYPAYSIRSTTNEDLNRFVSSSTASGTTLTSGTAPSFVKHSGPAQIRTIAPQDVPALPDKVGKMVFDKVLMKWVKNPAFEASVAGPGTSMVGGPEADAESEDPFRDIESLDDSRIRDHHDGHHTSRRQTDADADDAMSRIEEVSEVDGEEAELTSFSFDDPTAGIVPVMTGVESGASDGGEYDESTDSADEDGAIHAEGELDDEFDTEDELCPAEESLAEAESDMRHSIESMAVVAVVFSPPRRLNASTQASTPGLRSALKSTTATPVSAMKDPNRHRTPAQKHTRRRSVSFSDGKRDGPIRGVHKNMDDAIALSGSNILNSVISIPKSTPGFVVSARSKRITDLMQALESDPGSDDNESPTKTSTAERPDELQPLTSREPNSAAAGSSRGNDSRRVFSRSGKHALSPGRSHRGTSGNATFLTECSFGVAHDRLVQVITDVQPFEPHWEELSHIDLSDKKIESVARLKEFLPHLDSLSLNSNQLSWLSGVPSSVRTLSVASNSLTALSSFGHLLNLENLDISKNDIDSLRQLSCLRHLRELRADANKISSIDGLERMDGLVKLSLEGNIIRSVDLAQCRWTRLEMLNLSHNRLDHISGLASLPSLIALNADNNLLDELELSDSMPRMRILRLSGNRIRELNVALAPNLRTLYADNNSLASLVKVDRLTKLENLSLRNQSGRGLNLRTRDIRDVKRLYLSGNPLRSEFLEEPCYNLVYLELAACRLTALPEEMGKLVPNLRVLNLNYNFLEDASVRALGGLSRLRKLTIIGSRIRGTKQLIRLLQDMSDVEMLDFRMNPCTLGWYLPLLVKDIPGALQPSEGTQGSGSGSSGARGGKPTTTTTTTTTTSTTSTSGSSQNWLDLDTKFRRDLPDEAYIGRLAYRGLVMRACPRIKMLDGVEVSEKERRKAGMVLQGLVAKAKGSGKGVRGATGGKAELAKEGKGKDKDKDKDGEGKGGVEVVEVEGRWGESD